MHRESALIADITASFQRQRTEALTVDTIVARTVEIVPDAQHVSLTLRGPRNSFKTLGSTSKLATRADELQYEMNEGPCIEAALGVEYYRSGDVTTDERWTTWGPAVGDLGLRSVLSVRLIGERGPMGALNMYSEQTGVFDDRDELDFALVFASHVAQALTAARLLEGLETALDSRHDIGMALGMIMERYDCDEATAFAFVRRVSSHENRKLRDIAAEVIRDRRLPGFGTKQAPATG